MKRKVYEAPCCEVNDVRLEGMIAASLAVDTNPGDAFGGDVKDDNNNWNIWN